MELSEVSVGARVSLENWNARVRLSRRVPNRATVLDVDDEGDCDIVFDDGSYDKFHYSWLTPVAPLEQLAECADVS